MALLEVDGISVSFSGLQVLNKVSLTVESGQVHGLVGPNGAGKTTLFNCISGMQKVDAGKIYFDEQDLIYDPPHKRVGRGIARTFQNLALCNKLSVLDNVLLGTYHHYRVSMISFALLLPVALRSERAAKREALEYLELVGCSEYSASRAQDLPYGILKRVELARALACRPRFLLLDEPAAGLNTTERLQLMQLIQDIRSRGISILIVEHDMGMVMSACDQVTVLNFGEVIVSGTPTQILSNPEVITAYLGEEEQEVKKIAQC